jgi:TolB-like protein/class 3 adenylate cyclase
LASECNERRLAAILAADIAGYSRLVGADEAGTLARFNAHVRELIHPRIKEHRGRIIRTMGDSVLVEFASVVEALQCAVEMQHGMHERNGDLPRDERMEFRVGINVGDIIIEGGDIFGDGVNVAARLESIAEPGGICVSDDAYRQVRDKLKIVFDDTGEQQLKNIARPVRVYRARLDQGIARSAPAPALALPDRPSIAVLPFQNMSGDPEQEYFADGMVEDIITDLSRFRMLFVIARNSSFTYKGRAVDVKQVGRDLGVRYVLEGSVRKAGQRVRITGQLIDAATGAHLWAERFDGPLEDVFNLQDQVTSSVVAAIAPKVEQAEIERARRKPTESLEAYDYYLRGFSSFHQGSKKATAEALELFNKAIELDPTFASAYGMAAWCYATRRIFVWTQDHQQETAEAARLARRAAWLGKDDATALYSAGFALAYAARDYDTSISLIDRALMLNPNLGVAWFVSGWVRVLNGEPELAIEHFSRLARLSPFDPWIWGMHVGSAFAHFFAGRNHEAIAAAERGLSDRPNYLPAVAILASASALAGRTEQAQAAMIQLRGLDPGLRISGLQDRLLLRQAADLDRLAQGLRRAGMPES